MPKITSEISRSLTLRSMTIFVVSLVITNLFSLLNKLFELHSANRRKQQWVGYWRHHFVADCFRTLCKSSFASTVLKYQYRGTICCHLYFKLVNVAILLCHRCQLLLTISERCEEEANGATKNTKGTSDVFHERDQWYYCCLKTSGKFAPHGTKHLHYGLARCLFDGGNSKAICTIVIRLCVHRNVSNASYSEHKIFLLVKKNSIFIERN